MLESGVKEKGVESGVTILSYERGVGARGGQTLPFDYWFGLTITITIG